MHVTINGNPTEVASPSTVADLLQQLELADGPCAVERNREIVPKREHATTHVQEGDALEIVTLVGGG